VGYSISWLAAHGPAQEIRELLKLRLTGERLELPTAPIVGAELSTGWYLVVAKRCDHELIADRILQIASAKVDVIACSVEEHVMYSLASLWSGGTRVWSVTHDAQRAIHHLEASGQLPPAFSEIREQLLAQQAAEGGAEANVDFVFDVPLRTAQQITGFKHDEGGEPAHFDVLEQMPDSILVRARPWWRFW
jgi:hypothetical protein